MIFISIISFLISLIVPVLIIMGIVSLVNRNRTGEKLDDKNNNFEKDIRQLYIYIILTISLIATIVGIIATFNNTVEYLLPETSIETNDLSESRYAKIEQHRTLINLFTSVGVVAVSLPLFIYHNKLSKTLKDN